MNGTTFSCTAELRNKTAPFVVQMRLGFRKVLVLNLDSDF